MFKKYRNFVSGLVIGMAIMIVLPTFANDIKNLVIKNNEYPIEVNGAKAEINAYNIDDYTYLKLADVGKLLDSDVKFNEVDSKIEITKKKSEVNGVAILSSSLNDAETKNKEVDERKEAGIKARENAQPKQITKDGFELLEKDNIEYISIININKNIEHSNYKVEVFHENGNENVSLIMKDSMKKTINSIQYEVVDGYIYIKYDYFKDTILPLVK